MVLNEPLSADAATALVRAIGRTGDVGWSQHALDALAERRLQTPDCLNVLRCGSITEPADLEHGTWRYRIRTKSHLRRRGASFRDGIDGCYGMEDKAMKCINCGGTMKSTRGTHRYTESGLSGVTLINVEIRTCPNCGEREVVIPKINILHRMLARTLIREPGILKPEAVRFLRKWLGFSSADFALLMGVRPETVSRWENKDANYPLTATTDRLLRLLVANQGPVERYPIDLFKAKPRTKPVAIKLRAPDWTNEVAS